ncbi:MAG: hypothetical protein LQ347_000077 [Umbilicaria vellea]|nr:MAG: hypothetical protein LQ347_000077 [Umbilicaria vellea]
MSPLRDVHGPLDSNHPRGKNDKQIPKPPKAVFGDLATAHSSITSGSRGGFLKGPTSTNGESPPTCSFPLTGYPSLGNPQDSTALDQPSARNVSKAVAPGEGEPLVRNENGAKVHSMTDPNSEWTRLSTPIPGCDSDTDRPRVVDKALLETCPMSRNDTVPEALVVNTKQSELKKFEPVATGTSTTRFRRSASVSDMGRHAADYPESMYPGYGETSSGFDVAHEYSTRGFAAPIPEDGSAMLSKSSSYPQNMRSQHFHLPAGLGRSDIMEDFHEVRNFLGNKPHSVLKGDTGGSIVQEYSSEDIGENSLDYEAYDQAAEWAAFEDMTRYEAEEDEDGLDDDWASSNAANCSGSEVNHGTSAPATMVGLKDTEPMVNDFNPVFDQFRFSQFANSPQRSEDGYSVNGHSGDGDSVDGVETFQALPHQAPGQGTSANLPSPAPMFSLPQSPPPCFQRRVSPVVPDNSSTMDDCSRSSGSYGHTRNLLEMSSPQRPEQQLRASSASGRASPEVNQYRVSLLSSDGSLHSRPLSLRQARSLEAEIISHLRHLSDISTQSGHGSEVEPPNDHYTCHGRLSVDFFDDLNDMIEDLGPGGNQSSSSHDCLSRSGSYNLNAPNSGRSGRPGFYHDILTSKTRNGSPDPVRGRTRGCETQYNSIGGSVSGTDSVGTISDVHMYDDARVDEDKDWETVAESRNFSRLNTQAIMGRQQTGSSLADYSDSGSLSLPKLAPLFSDRVVQHPPHPRYAPRSFGLLRDKQSGELVLMPEYTFTDGAGLPQLNALAPPTANGALNNPYQHPAPLSRDHAHPFNSSPPLMSPGRSVPREEGSVHAFRGGDERNELGLEILSSLKYTKKDTYLAHELQSPVKVPESSYLPVKDGQRDVSLGTFGDGGIDGSFGSSAWLSTQDDAASVDCRNLPFRGGILSKKTVLGRKANLVGTPNGAAAQEIGSSLVDDTKPGLISSPSPNHHFSASPYAPLAPLAEPTSSRSKLAKSYCKGTVDGTVESTDIAAASDIYDRIRNNAIHHSSDLCDENEAFNTPQLNIHPIQIQKHRQHLIDHSLLPWTPSSSSAGSAHIPTPLNYAKNQNDRNMEKLPGTTAYDTIGTTLTSFSPSISGANARMRSPHRYVLSQDDAFDARKLMSFNETAPLSPPMPALQLRKLSKQQPKSGLLGWKKQRLEEGEAYPMQSLKARPSRRHGGNALDIEVAMTDGEASGSQAPVLFGPDKPVRLQHHLRLDGHSIIRAESPHLYRIPRPTTQAMIRRQRELSIMVLCLCFLCPPTLIIYGHGLMDGVMEWLTHGQINTFRPRDKTAALVIGYGGSVALFVGLIAGMLSVAMI